MAAAKKRAKLLFAKYLKQLTKGCGLKAGTCDNANCAGNPACKKLSHAAAVQAAIALLKKCGEKGLCKDSMP